ncbi:MAG: ATP-binding cassette domain-containing protein, partial [archaeon]|nr:ATP-binding cassette domain-containing protein [archaeon]
MSYLTLESKFLSLLLTNKELKLLKCKKVLNINNLFLKNKDKTVTFIFHFIHFISRIKKKKIPTKDVRKLLKPKVKIEDLEIYTENLTKTYGRGQKSVKAVDNISLRIEPGIHGFLGPNGAGKTTTINMLIGATSISNGKEK